MTYYTDKAYPEACSVIFLGRRGLMLKNEIDNKNAGNYIHFFQARI